MGTDQALIEYPEIFRKYFGTVVPPEDNKFAALNSAVWSGGSFVYVPKGVEVPLPLQAYFRINGENTGQFERTLIVVDEGAKVHYIEGCTAPIYATESLHAAVVEVIALPGSKVRYTTIQNWSNDVYNLVTKRAHAHYENATVEVGRCEYGVPDAGYARAQEQRHRADRRDPARRPRVLAHARVRDRAQPRRRDQDEPRGTGLRPHTEEPPARAGHRRTTPSSSCARQTRATRGLAPVASIVEGDEIAISGPLVPDPRVPHQFDPVPPRPLARGSRSSPPEESSEDLMWLLGFYLGDGYFDGPSRMAFACPTPTRRSRVVKLVDRLFGLGLSRARGVVLRVASATFADWLAAAGFSGNAQSKRIPGWVNRLPHSQKRALIDGYIAADGHMRPGHKNLDNEREPRAARAGASAGDLGRAQPVEDLGVDPPREKPPAARRRHTHTP